MQVTQVDWESNVIWDSTAPCWDSLKPAQNSGDATTVMSLECWARVKQGSSGRYMPWIPVTVAKPQVSNHKENFVSWFKFEAETLQKFESDVIWDPEQVGQKNGGAPKPTTFDLGDENIFRHRLLEYDEELERSRNDGPDSEQIKHKTLPHKHKTEALLGRYGFLKRFGEDQRGCFADMGSTSKTDPYNISNDEHYKPSSAALVKPTFQHAAPVTELRRPFIPTHLGPNALRKFHRPSVNLLVNGTGPHPISALTKRILKKAKVTRLEA